MSGESGSTSGERRSRGETRTRILAAATALLAEGGRDALTIRAVAAATGVQAPAIYRLFGEKGGLLDAVAQHGFASYLGEKQIRPSSGDPVEDLRLGWDLHVEFGLRNPAVYTLMYGDPRPDAPSSAATAAKGILQATIHRIALAGRLRVSEAMAVELVHAAGSGVVLSLLAKPVEQRDLTLSHASRDAAFAAILTDVPALDPLRPDPGPTTAAVTLLASLPEVATSLTDGERHVLAEWLARIAG